MQRSCVLSTEQFGQHTIRNDETVLFLSGTVTGLQQPGQEDLYQGHLLRLIVQGDLVFTRDEDVDQVCDALHGQFIVVRVRNIVDVTADVCVSCQLSCVNVKSFLLNMVNHMSLIFASSHTTPSVSLVTSL